MIRRYSAICFSSPSRLTRSPRTRTKEGFRRFAAATVFSIFSVSRTKSRLSAVIPSWGSASRKNVKESAGVSRAETEKSDRRRSGSEGGGSFVCDSWDRGPVLDRMAMDKDLAEHFHACRAISVRPRWRRSPPRRRAARRRS